MERKSFVFYASYWDAIQTLKRKNDRLSLMEAICEYALHGKETAMTDAAARIFATLKPTLDIESRSAEEVRRSEEYKAWRTAVFRRDDYTCQMCGARGVKVNAHHIKPFAEYHDLRIDVNNGITLCIACHKVVHHGA